jgi:hypothetical protein
LKRKNPGVVGNAGVLKILRYASILNSSLFHSSTH